MSSKLPKTILSLKQFLLRQEVLKLYREIFRTLRKIPEERTRLELKDWARADFRNNKHHTDETAIKKMFSEIVHEKGLSSVLSAMKEMAKDTEINLFINNTQ